MCLIALFFCQACDSGNREIRQAIETQLALYPESGLRDLYKSFFQDEYGPGHLLNDTVAARRYFDYELGVMTSNKRYEAEPCGRGKRFYRINLDLVKDSLLTADQFFDAFMKSAAHIRLPEISEWAKEWGLILSVVEQMPLSLPEFEDDKAFLAALIGNGEYVVHHSEDYLRRYTPNYRIMTVEAWDELKDKIDSTRIR